MFAFVGAASVFVTLLILTGPLFMVQLYDGIRSNRSEAPLVAPGRWRRAALAEWEQKTHLTQLFRFIGPVPTAWAPLSKPIRRPWLCRSKA